MKCGFQAALISTCRGRAVDEGDDRPAPSIVDTLWFGSSGWRFIPRYKSVMQEKALRSIMLVKAIEETDRRGTLIPVADRVGAAREASRGARSAESSEKGESPRGAALTESAQRRLAARADMLLQQVVVRHPIVETVLMFAGGPAWVGALLVFFGLLFGLLLSALDGTQRINVVAPGLLGLVLWNLCVYGAVLAAWIQTSASLPARRGWFADLLARNGQARAERFAVKAARFNTALAVALRRFAGQWHEAAKPLLVMRALRLFHGGAAAVGVGLIAGLYLRGLALDYQAGWGSTFLDAQQVHTLLCFIYGSASFVTGVAVPDAAHIAVIRWSGDGGGERAASWIHLIAASAALFIVLPRLVLALAGTLSIRKWSRHPPLPPDLTAYYRTVFSSVDRAIDRGIVMVVPYAYDPSAHTLGRLRTLLSAALGEQLTVDVRAPVAYGEEDSFQRRLADSAGVVADVIVPLFNLAATPEEENHGAVISGVCAWLRTSQRHAQLLVVVDEGAYAARMAAQGGATERMVERRRIWHDFIAAYGPGACITDLSRPALSSIHIEPGDSVVVEHARMALWQATRA